MSADTLIIREEAAADRAAIQALHRAAFGGEVEADLVDGLRDAGAAVLSLVAEEDGRIVGHVLFSRIAVETGQGPVAALALAPIAVVPARHGRGIGSRLVQGAHQQLADAGETLVFVVGDPGYTISASAFRSRRLGAFIRPMKGRT